MRSPADWRIQETRPHALPIGTPKVVSGPRRVIDDLQDGRLEPIDGLAASPECPCQSMSNRPNYYQVLHVQPDAPTALIRASHRTLMQNLRMHPDLGGSHEQAVLINEAFDTLSDPSRREAYDRSLGQAAVSPPPAAPVRRNATEQREPGPSPRPRCPFCQAPTYALVDSPDDVCRQCGSPLHPLTKRRAADSRRALERLPRHMPMTFRRAADPRQTHRGTTDNVSLHGARFTSMAPLDAGERISLDCPFCSAVATVRNVAHLTGSGGVRQVGVEFITLRLKHLRGGLVSTVA